MEDNSSDVAIGILLGNTAYSRRAKKWRELSLPGIKIDHFDPQTKIIKEVKKSSKLEAVHIAQVQYYLYRLEEVGVSGAHGLIEYPKLRKTVQVPWNQTLRQSVASWMTAIEKIIQDQQCPEVIKKAYCRTCAFRDFCYV